MVSLTKLGQRCYFYTDSNPATLTLLYYIHWQTTLVLSTWPTLIVIRLLLAMHQPSDPRSIAHRVTISLLPQEMSLQLSLIIHYTIKCHNYALILLQMLHIAQTLIHFTWYIGDSLVSFIYSMCVTWIIFVEWLVHQSYRSEHQYWVKRNQFFESLTGCPKKAIELLNMLQNGLYLLLV